METSPVVDKVLQLGFKSQTSSRSWRYSQFGNLTLPAKQITQIVTLASCPKFDKKYRIPEGKFPLRCQLKRINLLPFGY